ncbi:MAG: hypothetical protein IJ562_00705 [Prevotella sp.]|nr:hypothetical protein [Prevotella sp.]
MKKLFTLMALLLIVGGVKAQTTYSFDKSSITKDVFTITNGALDESNNKIRSDGGVDKELNVAIKDYPVYFTFTNKDAKDVFTNLFKNDYITGNSKNIIFNFTGVSVGNVIEIEYASKNDNAENIAGSTSGLAADTQNAASTGKSDFVKNKFVVEEENPTLQETNNGFFLKSITIYESADDIVPEVTVLTITEDTEFLLTQENADANAYFSSSTSNWTEEKSYNDGAYTGSFYNMSATSRQLTIKAKGASFFEVLVYNTNLNRVYKLTITPSDGMANEEEINHGGTGLESNGLYACNNESEIEIKLTGGGSSVYPVAIKFYTELPTVEVSVGADKFATYTPEVALNFHDSRSIKAYKASVSGNEITLTNTGIVAAGEGVLLYSATGEATENIQRMQGNPSASEDNAFVGVLKKDATVASEADGNKNYILNKINDKVGFYAANGQKVSKGKAYLSVPAASAKESYIIRFADDDAIVTGINEVKAAEDAKVIFNLNGMRVNDLKQKGVYIVNGKKVVIK